MGKKFSSVLAASSILAGVGVGAYMYLKKAGLISEDSAFPGKKLADKVSADAADKFGLERTYVDLSDVDEDDIGQPNLIKHTTIANFTISPKAEAEDEEPAENKILEPSAAPKTEEKPEPSVSPQEDNNDSLTGDGAVDEPEAEKKTEPETKIKDEAKTDITDQDIKDETIDADEKEKAQSVPAESVSPKSSAAESPADSPSEPANDPAPAEGIEDDDADLFTDGEGEDEENDEFEPGLGAPSIDIADSRTIGNVSSEEFFNDEN